MIHYSTDPAKEKERRQNLRAYPKIVLQYDVIYATITFLDKYCPEQFEIIGFGSGSFGVEIGVAGYKEEYLGMMGKTIPIAGNLYYVVNGCPVTPYKRILIRKKAVENEN